MRADKAHYALMSNLELINCLAVNGAKLANTEGVLLDTQRALDEARKAHESARVAADHELRERTAIKAALAVRGYTDQKMEAFSAKLQAHLMEFEKMLPVDEPGAEAREGAETSEADEGDEADGGEDIGGDSDQGEAVDGPVEEDAHQDVPADETPAEAEGPTGGEASDEGDAPPEIERETAPIVMTETRMDLYLEDGPAEGGRDDQGASGEVVASEAPPTAGDRASYMGNALALARAMGDRPSESGNGRGRNPLPLGMTVEHFDSAAISEQVHASDAKPRIEQEERLALAAPEGAHQDEAYDDLMEPSLSSRTKRRSDEEAGEAGEDEDPAIVAIANTAPGMKFDD